MTRKLKVAVVGLGVGQTHISRGYLPNPERFEVGVIELVFTLKQRELAVVDFFLGLSFRFALILCF